jgi:hypothetical protein
MAVPRPVLLALLGLALIGSALLATRGATSDEAVTAPAPPVTAPQAPKTKPDGRAERTRADAAKRRADRREAGRPPARGEPRGAAGDLGPVVEALGRDRVVVLFFTRPGAADDTGTRRAVNSLRGMKGVSVFSAGVEQLASYRPILSGVGVSQVPAVVVVRPGRGARLVEGFIDERSLRQRVADARR